MSLSLAEGLRGEREQAAASERAFLRRARTNPTPAPNPPTPPLTPSSFSQGGGARAEAQLFFNLIGVKQKALAAPQNLRGGNEIKL